MNVLFVKAQVQESPEMRGMLLAIAMLSHMDHGCVPLRDVTTPSREKLHLP